ncbi:hypothetical protein G4B88_018276 [Cannabis sativa]|uniref:Uncharacterized protein n=1 Tax=Cannabis sativa TaxID=3483 RepID=A0A7J6F3B5_CANSA|nr:hypothetical protein G4B88_018276 [Cannabis sativa]
MGQCVSCLDEEKKQQRKEEERLAAAEVRARAAEAAEKRQEQFEKSAAGRAARAQQQGLAKQASNTNKGEPVLKRVILKLFGHRDHFQPFRFPKHLFHPSQCRGGIAFKAINAQRPILKVLRLDLLGSRRHLTGQVWSGIYERFARMFPVSVKERSPNSNLYLVAFHREGDRRRAIVN